MIEWDMDAKEHEAAAAIAVRAVAVGVGRSTIDISMDIVATHTHGCKLELQQLLDADLGNFLHDVTGIAFNLNRETGQLENCFRPRHAAR